MFAAAAGPEPDVGQEAKSHPPPLLRLDDPGSWNTGPPWRRILGTGATMLLVRFHWPWDEALGC